MSSRRRTLEVRKTLSETKFDTKTSTVQESSYISTPHHLQTTSDSLMFLVLRKLYEIPAKDFQCSILCEQFSLRHATLFSHRSLSSEVKISSDSKSIGFVFKKNLFALRHQKIIKLSKNKNLRERLNKPLMSKSAL